MTTDDDKQLPHETDAEHVARLLEQSRAAAVAGEHEIARAASEIAKKTPAYDPQRKNPPDWLPKPSRKS
jgi:hypothetical protein